MTPTSSATPALGKLSQTSHTTTSSSIPLATLIFQGGWGMQVLAASTTEILLVRRKCIMDVEEQTGRILPQMLGILVQHDAVS